MKIFVYETYETKYSHHPISQYLKKSGHEVIFFDPTNVLTFNNRFFILRRICDKYFKFLPKIFINSKVKKIIKNNNFYAAIIVRGEHLLPETLNFFKKNNLIICNWSSDDFFNKVTTLRLMSRELVSRVIGCYDCIFTPRIHLEDEYKKCGAKSVQLLDWYYRPFLRDSKNLIPDNYSYNISFVGAWSPEREEWLSALHGFPINIWGWGWNKNASKTFIINNSCSGPVDMFQMSKIFNDSKINLNILTIQNRDTSNFRNFEIPAAGGFQLSEGSDHLHSLFKNDIEIALFSSKEELRSKVIFYLDNDQKREGVAVAGYNAIKVHDLPSRVGKIIDYLN